MFMWYRGLSLTVVYLRGISSQAQGSGGLRGNIWTTRAWTYQEYVAAETVQLYTEDWKPYLGLTLSNHKESPGVILEMEQVLGISSQDMAVLSPDLDRVHEKLYLASMRQTTLVEDIAYSLVGIFNVSVPVIYGEGNRAVGRLLEPFLTGSGDATILAWTGTAGTYNSCLPMDLAVYNQLVPPHVLPLIVTTELDRIVTELRSSLPDVSLVHKVCDRLNDLPLSLVNCDSLTSFFASPNSSTPQVQTPGRASMYIMRRRPRLDQDGRRLDWDECSLPHPSMGSHSGRSAVCIGELQQPV